LIVADITGNVNAPSVGSKVRPLNSQGSPDPEPIAHPQPEPGPVPGHLPFTEPAEDPELGHAPEPVTQPFFGASTCSGSAAFARTTT